MRADPDAAASRDADHSPQPAHPPEPASEPAIHLQHPTAQNRPRRATSPSDPVLIASQTLALPVDQTTLLGELELPPQASGLVVFGHCSSGSSRLSSRNRHLSRLLQQADLGSFSVDLRTPAETQLPALPQLTHRLVAVCGWLHRQPELFGMRLGLLGEGSAAAVSLEAAGQLGPAVGALVALGGEHNAPARPWSQLLAPTLLVVGGQAASTSPLARQQQAHQATGAPSTLHVVPQAGPTFQEPGTLAQAAAQAAAWFNCYLAKPSAARG